MALVVRLGGRGIEATTASRGRGGAAVFVVVVVVQVFVFALLFVLKINDDQTKFRQRLTLPERNALAQS